MSSNLPIGISGISQLSLADKTVDKIVTRTKQNSRNLHRDDLISSSEMEKIKQIAQAAQHFFYQNIVMFQEKDLLHFIHFKGNSLNIYKFHETHNCIHNNIDNGTSIYRAEKLYYGKKVTIKSVNKCNIYSINEINMLFYLKNIKCIPQVDNKFKNFFNFGHYGEKLCIAKRYFEDVLENILFEITKEEALRAFLQIYRGINFLHDNNLTHGDLKTSNIYYDSEKDIYVISDFESMRFSESPYINALPFPNSEFKIMTSPLYSSGKDHVKIKATEEFTPEMKKWREAKDIYALGIIAFKLFTKTNDEKFEKYLLQFGSVENVDGLNTINIKDEEFLHKASDEFLQQKEVDKDLRKLIIGMMQQDPEKRVSSLEVEEVLSNYFPQLELSPKPKKNRSTLKGKN